MCFDDQKSAREAKFRDREMKWEPIGDNPPEVRKVAKKAQDNFYVTLDGYLKYLKNTGVKRERVNLLHYHDRLYVCVDGQRVMEFKPPNLETENK